MLQFMRERASSWMIKAILSIVILAFIFIGVGNFGNRDEVVAATVNGEKISVAQFQDRYYLLLDNARQQFGKQLNDELLEMMNLKEQALDQLIAEAILLQKARELGFQVSDQELSSSIMQMSFFQQGGRFNRNLYNRILQRHRMTPEIFEQQQRRDLLTQKVRALITDSVKVSGDESRRWYDWQNCQIKIKIAVFQPDAFSQIKPSEEALEHYFNENKETYKTEEKLQVTYMSFNPDDFTSGVTLDDAEIQQYYEDNQEDYGTEKTVEVSHILIKMAENAPEAIVSGKQAEAMKIYDMVASGKDFADCARQYSEDTSAPKGGTLGTFKKHELAAPFAEQAFSMEAGDISRPVRTQSGWHIIKVNKINDASVTPLSQVKADIRNLLALQKARDLAYEEALRLFDAAINKNSIKEAAKQLDKKAQTTPLFSRTDKLEKISGSSAFIGLAFDLPEEEISDVVEVGGIYYVLQIDQRLAPEVPELKAVRQRVVDDLTAQMQNEKAKTAAETFLKMIREGGSLEKAAEETQARLITTEYLKRGQPVTGIDNEPEISREAFLLSPDSRLADKVIDGQTGYYVIYLDDRRLPEEDAFTGKKDEIAAQLMQLKKQDAFSAWLAAMKTESEITRDERFLK